MYKQQEIILKEKNNINQWQSEYIPSADSLQCDELENFKVRVPLVGMFSSGKSSLLNTFMDKKILPLDITPESSVAIELSFSETDKIQGVSEKGLLRELSFEDLKDKKVASELVAENAWIQAQLNVPILKKFPHITFVDLPGLNSGQDIHGKAIDLYMARSLAYCIVVSVDDGELNTSVQNFITELSYHNKPILLVITKADKRPEEDTLAVAQKIQESAEYLIGKPLLASIVVSRHDKEKLQREVVATMQALENQAELVFQNSIGFNFIATLNTINKQIDVLLNKDDLNSEELAVKQAQLREDMQHFEQQLQQETQNLESSADGVATSVSNLVRSRVLAQRSELASACIYGGDINTILGPTIRSAITEGLQNDFLPKVNKYIKKIDQNLPMDIRVDANFKVRNVEIDNIDAGSISAILLPVLSKVLMAIPVARLLLPILDGILGLLAGSKQKPDRRAQQEEAGAHVDAVIIPRIVSDADKAIRTFLSQQIAEVKQNIAQTAQQSSAELEHSLEEVRKQLEVSAEDFKVQQEKYLTDKAAINSLIEALQRI